MDASEWKPITPTEPAEGVRVLTRIDDGKGVRNEQHMYRHGRLWFMDSGMYVYYTPTHYAPERAPLGRCPRCNRPLTMHPTGNFPECLPCHQEDMRAHLATDSSPGPGKRR